MPEPASLVDAIDALLPQTQCRQCGYAGCRPYAEAIVAGEAEINRCPPGGSAGIARLAELLDRAVRPLDPACGTEAPRVLARIIEEDCIGCTKCIQACPVDAIVGAGKLMHTIIADQCTGCELCIEACPVDCIIAVPMPTALQDQAHADAARENHRLREARLARQREERRAELARRKAALHAPRIREGITRGEVYAAIDRARARRAARRGEPS